MSNNLQESIGIVMSTFPHMDFLEAYEYCVDILKISDDVSEED
jgi:hypothetical protein